MPEENAPVTENTTDPKNVIARSEATKQTVDTPPPQSVEAPAQQSFEIPPFTPPPSAPSIALEPVIADPAPESVISPKNVIAEPAPKNVIARSPQATKQSVDNPPPSLALPPEEVTTLNTRLAALAAENAAAAEIISRRHADLIALQGSHDSAVSAYRNLLISTNPAVFSEDCLPGVTIQEIEASAKKVNDIAAKVRAQLQADIKSVIVPAGAPERSGPDTSALSSIDKIKYAIQNSSSLRGTP